VTGGALLGTDYQFANHFYLGCAFGYTHTNLHWKESAGKANINSYYSTLYSTWFNNRAFIDATIITAFNQYHAERKISFPGVHRTASNHHRGYQVGTSLGSGVFFTPGKFQVTPYVRLDYIFLHQNGFTESGAQSLNLKVHDTNSRYFRSDAGVKMAYCRRYEDVAITPYIKASWIFEKQLDEAKFTAGFVHSHCKFSDNGMRPVRSLFAPSVGVTVLAYEDAFSFEFHDDVEVSKKFWENRAYLNFAYRF
jgi:outer membrane autotransporter protein